MTTKAKVNTIKKEVAKEGVKKPNGPLPTEKQDKKNGKDTEKLASSEVEGDAPAIDLDELEEQQDAAAAESSSQNGNAAALAAAGSASEMSASFKNFRHHPDMENFYRFIFENDLRHEALAIIDEIMVEKQQRKVVKGAKAQAH